MLPAVKKKFTSGFGDKPAPQAGGSSASGGGGGAVSLYPIKLPASPPRLGLLRSPGRRTVAAAAAGQLLPPWKQQQQQQQQEPNANASTNSGSAAASANTTSGSGHGATPVLATPRDGSWQSTAGAGGAGGRSSGGSGSAAAMPTPPRSPGALAARARPLIHTTSNNTRGTEAALAPQPYPPLTCQPTPSSPAARFSRPGYLAAEAAEGVRHRGGASVAGGGGGSAAAYAASPADPAEAGAEGVRRMGAAPPPHFVPQMGVAVRRGGTVGGGVNGGADNLQHQDSEPMLFSEVLLSEVPRAALPAAYHQPPPQEHGHHHQQQQHPQQRPQQGTQQASQQGWCQQQPGAEAAAGWQAPAAGDEGVAAPGAPIPSHRARYAADHGGGGSQPQQHYPPQHYPLQQRQGLQQQSQPHSRSAAPPHRQPPPPLPPRGAAGPSSTSSSSRQPPYPAAAPHAHTRADSYPDGTTVSTSYPYPHPRPPYDDQRTEYYDNGGGSDTESQFSQATTSALTAFTAAPSASALSTTTTTAAGGGGGGNGLIAGQVRELVGALEAELAAVAAAREKHELRCGTERVAASLRVPDTQVQLQV